MTNLKLNIDLYPENIEIENTLREVFKNHSRIVNKTTSAIIYEILVKEVLNDSIGLDYDDIIISMRDKLNKIYDDVTYGLVEDVVYEVFNSNVYSRLRFKVNTSITRSACHGIGYNLVGMNLVRGTRIMNLDLEESENVHSCVGRF